MYLVIASLAVGVAWGWMFYEAVMNKKLSCIIMWAISLSLWQADKFFNSEIVRRFIKEFTGE